jgi:hypothetical protein
MLRATVRAHSKRQRIDFVGVIVETEAETVAGWQRASWVREHGGVPAR